MRYKVYKQLEGASTSMMALHTATDTVTVAEFAMSTKKGMMLMLDGDKLAKMMVDGQEMAVRN